MNNKAKIVATIGPSSWSDEVLLDMINQGLTMARINASFADFAELSRVSEQLRRLSPQVAILLDTMGHKIRVTGFEDEKDIKKETEIILVSENVKLENTINVTYPTLAEDLTRGVKILIDDGNIVLRVANIIEQQVICKVEVGGILKKKKTVNIPGVHLNFPDLSEKDYNDIKFAVENGFEYISGSFVRNAEDVELIREAMGSSDAKLIAKIENYEGVQNFDSILEKVDGIMVARGDLGVELPIEQVPIYQKEFIRKCREKGKLVIVATQMLESMRSNPRPTRAEVSDVENAVWDGADALMLSAETSTGQYPVQAVEMMRIAIEEAEKIIKTEIIPTRTDASLETDTLAENAWEIAEKIGAVGIIDFSVSGKTTSSLSRHTTNKTIWSICANPKLYRQLFLRKGVRSIYIKDFPIDRDEMIKLAVNSVYGRGEVGVNDKVIVIGGSTINKSVKNSMLEIVEIKDYLN